MPVIWQCIDWTVNSISGMPTTCSPIRYVWDVQILSMNLCHTLNLAEKRFLESGYPDCYCCGSQSFIPCIHCAVAYNVCGCLIIIWWLPPVFWPIFRAAFKLMSWTSIDCRFIAVSFGFLISLAIMSTSYSYTHPSLNQCESSFLKLFLSPICHVLTYVSRYSVKRWWRHCSRVSTPCFNSPNCSHVWRGQKVPCEQFL